MAKRDKTFSFPVRLSDEVERLFDEIIHRPWGFMGELKEWHPSIDLYETSEVYILEADLPGVKGEDVRVDVEDSDLILQGRRFFERNHKGNKFYCQERSCGDFIRRIRLPESVDRDEIKAEFKDGVLRVVVPKIKKRGGES
jgi:HSP20 family protein